MNTVALETKSGQSEYCHNGKISKIERYGWSDPGDKGEFMEIDKNLLRVDPEYQRGQLDQKIRELASKFLWRDCGVISVADRDGEYFVTDGQHRVLAAQRRTDITTMPCLVFSLSGKKEEANAFLGANTHRKPVTSYGKHKAKVVSGDGIALFIDNLCGRLGITLKENGQAGAMQTKAVTLCYRLAQMNIDGFVDVMEFLAALCKKHNHPLSERLIDGLFYLNSRGLSLNDKRIRDRIMKVGPERLLNGAAKASALYAKGGAKIWADGMLVEINKGSRTIYEMTN